MKLFYTESFQIVLKAYLNAGLILKSVGFVLQTYSMFHACMHTAFVFVYCCVLIGELFLYDRLSGVRFLCL